MSVDVATLGTVPAPHGPGRRRSAAELEAIALEASVRFADATADDVLAWAAEAFGDSLAVACSMAGDTVVPHLAARHRPGVDVLFLQTGYILEGYLLILRHGHSCPAFTKIHHLGVSAAATA